ncbi:carbohydrate ABC transporter permease [Microbacterium sp. SLBN-146]|uniref:carbohydrate ABC transporter permease n=1 Tax=Microbacterium sp. SLBN-146 TaxID=2768457 RepID=UPI00114F8060|nr:sugar ABC transporter permease [Microbacterium sp. SLBN-146]TQJ30447.1 carbohydrate ABC transporter membrane protein 1 (CUT1 family) [Microbacterium sp. SLBN-146]
MTSVNRAVAAVKPHRGGRPTDAKSQPRAGDPSGTFRRQRKFPEAHIGLAFVSPMVIGVIVLCLIPFISVIWYSLHDWDVFTGSFEFIGLGNYARLVNDAVAAKSLGVTGLFMATLMIVNIVLAMLLALLVNQRLRGVSAFRAIYFAPVVVAVVAWVIIWQFLLASNGGINGFLAMVGVEGPNWLRDPNTALYAVVIVQVFKGVGMNMVLFLAALQGVPSELKEAARIDGASNWRIFWSVVLPMLSPTLLLVMILTSIGALDVFAPIQVLTQGGPSNSTLVLSYYMYQTAFERQDFGYGSTLGVVLFVIVLALTAVQWRLRKVWVHDEV